jgi:hypothetical protein
MRTNWFQLNASMHLCLICESSVPVHLQASPVRVGNEFVMPVTSVRYFGILLDSELSMNNHIASRCLSRPVLEALVVDATGDPIELW